MSAKLNDREKKVLRDRRDHYKRQIHKHQEDQKFCQDLRQRIKTLNKWLEGTPGQNGDQPLDRATFNKMVQAVFGVDVTKPGAAITLTTRKDVDRLMPGLAMSNVAISAPNEIKVYLKEKIDEFVSRQGIGL